MKKLLITGGAGLVGKYISQDLASEYDVAVADKVAPGFDVKYYNVDVTKSVTLKSITGQFDAIIHLAGAHPSPSNAEMDETFYVNTLGTFNIMHFAAVSGVKKVLFASTDTVLGFPFAKNPRPPLYFPIDEQHPLEPQDTHGLSKLCAEETMKSFARAYGISAVALRFPWVWVPEGQRAREVSSPNFRLQKLVQKSVGVGRRA